MSFSGLKSFSDLRIYSASNLIGGNAAEFWSSVKLVVVGVKIVPVVFIAGMKGLAASYDSVHAAGLTWVIVLTSSGSLMAFCAGNVNG